MVFADMMRTLPRKMTKSPTVLIATTRRTLLSKVLKALTLALQKFVELIAANKHEEAVMDDGKLNACVKITFL